MQDYRARVGWMEPQGMRAEKQTPASDQLPISFDTFSDHGEDLSDAECLNQYETARNELDKEVIMTKKNKKVRVQITFRKANGDPVDN